MKRMTMKKRGERKRRYAKVAVARLGDATARAKAAGTGKLAVACDGADVGQDKPTVAGGVAAAGRTLKFRLPGTTLADMENRLCALMAENHRLKHRRPVIRIENVNINTLVTKN